MTSYPLKNITIDDQEPNPDIEYIFTYNAPELYLGDQKYSSPVPKGTICINVHHNYHEGEKHGYNFTVKETGEQHRTYYAWALAENTSHNQQELEKYWKLQEEVKLAQEQVRQQGLKIGRLIK